MTKKILIVDDKKNIVALIKRILERKNFKVITASNGKEALEKVYDKAPDLMILAEMDGCRVCKEIRQDPLYRRLPIIMLNGKATTSTHIKALNLGADVFMSKPFRRRELVVRIKSLLRNEY